MDSTAIKAYSQRDLENKRGKSDFDARVGRGRRGFVLGYKVHTVCCTSSELPLAFTVQPCNMNEKRFINPLLKKLHGKISFKTVIADAQYDSAKVRDTVRCWVLNQSYLTGKAPRSRAHLELEKISSSME